MMHSMVKSGNDNGRIFDEILCDFFQIRNINDWWLPVTLYLLKEGRLSVKDDIQVDYSDASDLEMLVKAIFPSYPLVGEGDFNVNTKLLTIARRLSHLSVDWYASNYQQAYNHIVEKVVAQDGRRSGEYVQPAELTQLAVNVLQYEGGSVYNPFAGLCSYAIALGADAQFTAQEISQTTYNLARFNMLANGLDYRNLRNEDSVLGFRKSDYIITTPPFGMRISHPGYNNSDLFVFEKVALKAEKRAVVMLPSNVLHRGGSYAATIRKNLVEADLIDSIIFLPTSVLRSTSIPVVMVVFDKHKVCKGKVKMINLADCYKDNRLGKTLDLDKALDIISNSDSKYVLSVDNADIESCQYDLRLLRYVQPEINVPAGYKLCSLSDIVERLRLPSYDGSLKLPKLSFSKTPYWGNELTVVEGGENFPNGYIVEENALIVAAHGDSMRSAFFDASNGAAVIPAVSKAFRLVASDIDRAYLLMELGKDYVKSQLGVGYMSYSVEDILRLKILLPDIETQRNEVIKAQRQYLQQSGIQINELHEEFVRDMHMKKHAIGQTLFNLSNWWDALQQARKDGNGVVADDATIGRNHKVSVASIYDNIHKTINQLQQQIGKFDSGNGLEIKEFALAEFIENYIIRKQSPLFIFSYDKLLCSSQQPSIGTECEEFIEEEGGVDNIILNQGNSKEYVKFAPDALEIIFDNIVSNACCHGFENRDGNKNVIRIELMTKGDHYVIIVSNNGLPMHKKLRPDEVFVYGKTSKMGKSSSNDTLHFGLGGYEVKKLMREFGGDAELISEPESDFPVSYKLTFYDTNLNK